MIRQKKKNDNDKAKKNVWGYMVKKNGLELHTQKNVLVVR